MQVFRGVVLVRGTTLPRGDTRLSSLAWGFGTATGGASNAPGMRRGHATWARDVGMRRGHATWAAAGAFIVPAVMGNVVGGVTFVAMLNHGQVCTAVVARARKKR